jgi:hypothetical protein
MPIPEKKEDAAKPADAATAPKAETGKPAEAK